MNFYMMYENKVLTYDILEEESNCYKCYIVELDRKATIYKHNMEEFTDTKESCIFNYVNKLEKAYNETKRIELGKLKRKEKELSGIKELLGYNTLIQNNPELLI